jgi:hypothetical protein
MEALSQLQSEGIKLDNISQKADGQVAIKEEEWYKRGQETETDTQKAISSPLDYLTKKGQLQIYLDDIKRQRAAGKNVGHSHIVKKYRL